MEAVAPNNVVYEFGRFSLDPHERTLYSEGVPLHLPAKEFDTLLLLVENNRKALSKEEMMTRIWHDAFVEEVNLAKQISRLRKIFNSEGKEFIETLPKHGYRFTADMRRVVPAVDDVVVLEKRTIKRVTFAVESREEAERPALPSARAFDYRSTWAALVLGAATLGSIFLLWQNRPSLVSAGPEAVDPYAPVRLTNHPADDTGPQWSKDGRIRFTRFLPDKKIEMWVTDPDGTKQSLIPMPERKRIFSWSPDEKKVLFQKDGDAKKGYLSNADGSGEVLLPFIGGNWSADSTMIAYRAKATENNHDIFIYSVETGKSRNITNHEAFDADPSFSPDGKQIVFVSARDGNGEIYSINIDGGNLRRLTFDPKTDSHPAFSPDGTQISFNSDRENENADVYLMNADGSNTVKLTNFDKSNETLGPGGWSPDGTKIAFFSDRDGKDDIYVMSAEAVRPKLVFSDRERDIRGFAHSPDGSRLVVSEETADKSGELKMADRQTGRTSLIRKTELAAVTPEWSPDGAMIAYADRINGNSEVCAIKPDGSGWRNLTNQPVQDFGPSWSPDGKRLSFITTRGEPSQVSQLYTMNADGSEPAPVTPRKGWEGGAVWQPDGRKIVFSCDRNDSPGNLLDICRINPGGGGEERILLHRGHDAEPAVSPDGSRIAFAALADGNAEIYVVNAEGSGLLRITRNTADDQTPKWSPDGKRLTFLSNRGGKFAIYEIEVS